MNLKEQEKVCPLCGQDNNCQHGQENCWCETTKFPEHIFEMIPEDKRGKACICKSCLEKYRDKTE